MTNRQLYVLPVPDNAQERSQSQQRRRQASSGALGDDAPAVESISPDAESRMLVGSYRGQFAELLAAQFEELFAASGYMEVPFYTRGDEQSADDGYYTLSDTTVQAEDPRDPRYQRFDGTITHVGSRGSHWRAVRTHPTTEDNPFGTGSTAEIGVSVDAAKVRWFDSVGGTGTIEAATVQRTVTTEHGDVDVYDATEPSFDSPVLIFDVPYASEYPTDCRVWDDYDRSKTTTIDGEEVVQWQRCFTTLHDFRGTPLVENGRIRLEIDEAGGELRAYEWDDANATYAQVSLGTSDWRLYDLSLTHIGQARVDAQVEFEDTSASSLTTHNLDMSLKRGYQYPLWLNPANEGSVPQGLIDRLDPIAETVEVDPAAANDLLTRREVNR